MERREGGRGGGEGQRGEGGGEGGPAGRDFQARLGGTLGYRDPAPHFSVSASDGSVNGGVLPSLKLSLGDLFSSYLSDGMPCLQSEPLQEPMASDERLPTPPLLLTLTARLGRKACGDQCRMVFSRRLWSPRTKTRRWGEMVGSWFVETVTSPQTSRGPSRSPSDPSSSMLLLGRGRDTFPLSSPSLRISTSASIPSLSQPPSHQTSTLSTPRWGDPLTLERAGSCSPRTPRSPHSPVSSRSLRCPHSPSSSPRSSPRFSPRSPRRTRSCGRGEPCGRGEGCDWMMKLLAGGSGRIGSVAELCQGALLHALEVVGAERCSLSLLRQVFALDVGAGRVKEESSSNHAHLG
ncbi:unnamed protein product [Coregonus sp. 'balchen']|nr:unnamed protein product [Coregonus sp. 'balchen']